MPNPGHSAAVLSAAFALALAAQAAPARAASELFFVSTYIAPPAAGQPPVDRSGNGIYAVRLDTVSGALTGLGMKAPLDRASWLAANPKRPVIYSVADSGGGITTESEVRSFVADPATGALKPLNKVGSGGRDATHLAIDPASMTLFAANHDTGQVTAFPLLPDGAVGPLASSQQDVGTGPHPRQNRPQAHAVFIDPSGHYLIDNDFGADRIFAPLTDGTVLLLPLSALPWWIGGTGAIYGVSALVLSALFVMLAARVGVRVRTGPDDGMKPERQLFKFSILYLFVLFAALVADRWLLVQG